MANTKSAKIADRKATRRTEVNKARKSRIKTFIKKVEEAVSSGKHDEALKALRSAEAEIMRGVSKRVLKLNSASRKVSRLNASVKKLKTNSKAS